MTKQDFGSLGRVASFGSPASFPCPSSLPLICPSLAFHPPSLSPAPPQPHLSTPLLNHPLSISLQFHPAFLPSFLLSCFLSHSAPLIMLFHRTMATGGRARWGVWELWTVKALHHTEAMHNIWYLHSLTSHFWLEFLSNFVLWERNGTEWKHACRDETQLAPTFELHKWYK